MHTSSAWDILNYVNREFFSKQSHPKKQDEIANIHMACWGIQISDPWNKTCVAPPTLPYVQHPYYTVQMDEFVDYIYMSLWLILLQCKWIRLNQHDRILLCSQNFATWKSLWLRSKNALWCQIGKWHCLKTCCFKTTTWFFRHPPRIFLRTSRVTAESTGALHDGANVVHTETWNYFCLRICYKFLISNCRGG